MNFKKGDKVIAVKDHRQGHFKKGDEFSVDSFECCPSCGIQCISLVGIDKRGYAKCLKCNHISNGIRRAFFELAFFTKPLSLSDAVEYKLKVSIPELTKIEEPQLQ